MGLYQGFPNGSLRTFASVNLLRCRDNLSDFVNKTCTGLPLGRAKPIQLVDGLKQWMGDCETAKPPKRHVQINGAVRLPVGSQYFCVTVAG
jgi:hypothetical protein